MTCPDAAEATIAANCARDPQGCAACGARAIIEHGRDEKLAALLDALDEAQDGVTCTLPDMSLFLARLLELVIREGGTRGLALARGALLLAEANAQARHNAASAGMGRRLHG